MRQIALPLSALAGVILWSGLVLTGGAQVRDRVDSAQNAPSADDLAQMSAESAEAEAILAQAETGDESSAETATPEPETPPAVLADKPAVEERATAPQMERNTARPVRNTARPVQPGAFAYPVVNADTPLERIEPKEPPAPPPRTPITLQRPGVVKAGLIAIRNRSLGLAGVTPTELGRTCPGASGKEWPCGVAARTAMRLFLRNRAIACDLPRKDWESGSTATCKIGDTDIGAWLVSSGWAQAVPGSPYEPLEEEARKARKGLFGDDPRRDGADKATP